MLSRRHRASDIRKQAEYGELVFPARTFGGHRLRQPLTRTVICLDQISAYEDILCQAHEGTEGGRGGAEIAFDAGSAWCASPDLRVLNGSLQSQARLSKHGMPSCSVSDLCKQ